MSCARAGQLLEGQLNRELNWRGRIELRLHLLMCSLCRRYHQQAVKIRQLLRAPAGEPQPRLSPEAKTRIARRIAEATELKP